MPLFPTRESVAKEVERFYLAHPELDDPLFIAKYPHARQVVESIDALADLQRVFEGRPTVYKKLGISNTREFIALVRDENEAALKLYRDTEKGLLEE